jgi:hypothetical protein
MPFSTRLPGKLVVVTVVVAGMLVATGWFAGNAFAGHSSSPAGGAPSGTYGPRPAALSLGNSVAVACSAVTACTTGSLAGIGGGDALVVVVSTYDGSAGAPSAVTEITTSGNHPMSKLGVSTCTGSVRGLVAIFGLATVAAQTSVTFQVQYATTQYFTIVALDVAGAGPSPFETAGASGCATNASSVATAPANTTAANDVLILGVEVRASTAISASGGDTVVKGVLLGGTNPTSGAMLYGAAPTAGSYNLSATFASARWSALAVGIKPVQPLVAGTVTPSAATIDAGQSTSFTAAAATGGIGPYAYQWLTGSATCSSGSAVPGASSLNYSTPALTAGTYDYCLRVTDTTTSTVAYSNVAVVTVNTALTVSITPAAPSIDRGQTVTLTAHPAGGTGADTYSWYGSAACSGAILATTVAYTTVALVASATYCVSVKDSVTPPSVATSTATVTVSGAVLSVGLAPASPTIDPGQSVTLNATASGGTGAVSYAWHAGVGCSGAVLGTSASFATGALNATQSFCVAATDSAYQPVTATSTATVTVSAQNLSASIVPSNPQIDFGQSVTLNVSASGGTGPLAYAWYADGTCTGTVVGTGVSFTTPALPSNASYCSAVTDSAYAPVTVDATASVVVSAAALGVGVAPAAPSIDPGQSVALLASASGGTGPYTYAWYAGAGCSGPTVATTATFTTPALSSSTTYCIAITDSALQPTTTTTDVTVTVSASPLALGILPGTPQIDPGQSVNLTAIPSGGTGSYSYAWFAGTSCTGAVLASTATLSTGPLASSAGYCAVVTDSAYAPESTNATVVVNVSATALSVSILPSAPSLDFGQSVDLTAVPAGGTGSDTFAWYSGVDCTGAILSTGAHFPTPSLGANSSFCVAATDSSFSPATATSSVNITVSTAPLSVVSVSPSFPSIDRGQSISLSVNASGGTGTDAYAWFGTADCSGPVLSTSRVYTAPSLVATTTFCVQVTDSAYQPVVVNATDTVTVSANALAASVVPPSPDIDPGQSVALTASPSGGTGAYSYAWYAGSICSGSVLATSATYRTAALSANSSFCVSVQDSAYAPVSVTAVVNVVVSNGPLTIGSVTPLDPQVDHGGTINLTVNAFGGTGADTYAWYAGAVCSGAVLATTSTLATGTLSANTTFCVKVTDSSFVPQTATASVTVTVSGTALSVVIGPASPTVDLGSGLTLTANVSGGFAPYAYAWYAGATCVGPVLGRSATLGSGALAANRTFCVAVTDSASTPAQASATDTVTVTAAPLAIAGISPPSPSLDAGQALNLTVNVTGGTGTYSYSWFSGVSCTGAPIATAATLGTGALENNSTFCVKVVDTSTNASALTATVVVTVSAAVLSVGVVPPTAVLDPGQNVSLTAVAHGGTAPYTFAWFAAAGCTGPVVGVGATLLTGALVANTTYCVLVHDSSTVPASAQVSVVIGVASSPLAVSIAPGSPQVGLGQNVTLTAVPTGGTAPYVYSWYAGGACSGTVLATGVVYTTPSLGTNSTYCVRVTDSALASENATANVSVGVSAAALGVTISPAGPGIDHGQAVVLTATPAGGVAPYAYAWYVGASCAGTVVGSAGGYSTPVLNASTTFCVQVTDSAVSPTTATASTVVTVSALALSVGVTPASPTIDSGQSVNLTATAGGGTGADSFAWFAGSACSGTVLGVGPVLDTGALTTTGTFCVVATDSSYTPASANTSTVVTVSPTALGVQIVPGAPSIDAGQSVRLSANVSGGTAPYTYAWYGNAACVGTVLSTAVSFNTTAGAPTTTYCVVATDSAFAPASVSATSPVSVSTSVLGVSIAPGAATIDRGQSIVLTAQPSGGTGAVGYTWYAGASCTGTVLSTAQTYSTSALTASGTFCVVATDSAYTPASAQSSVRVSVSAASLSVSMAPLSPALDAGQSLGLSATALGGVAPLDYAWFANAGCAGPVLGAAATYTTDPLATTVVYCVQVTDSAYVPVTVTASTTVTVNTALTAAISSDIPSVGYGGNVTLTGEVHGGTGAHTFAWYAGATCTGAVLATTPSYTTPTLTANASYCLRVTDSSYIPQTATVTTTVTVYRSAPAPSFWGSNLWLDLAIAAAVALAALAAVLLLARRRRRRDETAEPPEEKADRKDGPR